MRPSSGAAASAEAGELTFFESIRTSGVSAPEDRRTADSRIAASVVPCNAHVTPFGYFESLAVLFGVNASARRWASATSDRLSALLSLSPRVAESG